MNVILKENVENLGSIGEVVRVSEGYARNFLLPRKLATVANPNDVKQMEHQKRALKNKLAKVKEEMESQKLSFEAVSLVIRRKAGEGNKLFGSITSADIAEAMEAKGFKLDRKAIELEAPIKKLGTEKVSVRLMEGVIAEINLSVVADVE